jgi:cystathionine beta-lyase/cystathionine gamma-synthase
VNVQPAKLGFDITLHSATKYLNGHSDLIAGVVLGGQELIKTIRVTANVLGWVRWRWGGVGSAPTEVGLHVRLGALFV